MKGKRKLPLSYIFRYFAITHRGAPDYSVIINRDPFWKAGAVVGIWIRDEVGHQAIQTANIDATMPAWVVAVLSFYRTGLRVDDIKRIILNSHAAGSAEMLPDCQQFTLG